MLLILSIICILILVFFTVEFFRGKKWVCKNGKCIQKNDGTFSSKKQCEKSCQNYTGKKARHKSLLKTRRFRAENHFEFIIV